MMVLWALPMMQATALNDAFGEPRVKAGPGPLNLPSPGTVIWRR